jgi:hypothetical protein
VTQTTRRRATPRLGRRPLLAGARLRVADDMLVVVPRLAGPRIPEPPPELPPDEPDELPDEEPEPDELPAPRDPDEEPVPV